MCVLGIRYSLALRAGDPADRQAAVAGRDRCRRPSTRAAPAAEAATLPVAPGGNLPAAYNPAQSGDVIELACGSYGEWDQPDGGSKQVTVRAATRNCAKFSRLHAHSSNITFDGLDIDAGGGFRCAAALRVPRSRRGATNRNITFKNGRIGNVGGQKGAFLHGSDRLRRRVS